MRQKQDQDKRDLVEAQRSMSSIEAKAQRQYEADQKAAQESLKQRLGEWVSVHAATNLSKTIVPCCAQIQAETTFALPALLLTCILMKSWLNLFLHITTLRKYTSELQQDNPFDCVLPYE